MKVKNLFIKPNKPLFTKEREELDPRLSNKGHGNFIDFNL